MKELIDPNAVEKALLLLAVAGPLVGAILGALLGAREKRVLPRIVGGALVGAIGTLVWVMWRVYNLITNVLGLDSVANLVVQLVMFAVLGGILGFAISKVSAMLGRLGADQ